MSGSFPGLYGNFKFHALFLHPEHMKFPEITGNFIWSMYFPVQGHVTFTGISYTYLKFLGLSTLCF